MCKGMEMLANAMVTSCLQHINVLSQHTVHLKLTQHRMSKTLCQLYLNKAGGRKEQ